MMRSILLCCLFTNICFLCLPYKSFCADSKFKECKKDKFCGNQTIRFPFYTEKNLGYCGYPGFELTCLNNNVLLLNISQAQYRITDIFYTNTSFRVSNILSSRSGFCSLDKIRNLSLPIDHRFQLQSTAYLTLLSDCKPEPPQTLSRNKVGCSNDSNWVLAMKSKDPELFYATAACETIAVAPIRDYSEDDTDYLKLIRNGFDLKWVATDCSKCEASKGYCGSKGGTDNKFQCFCDDRPHSRRCKKPLPSEQPLPTKETNNSRPVCPNSFSCQNISNLSFPFYIDSTDRRCGLCKLKCNEAIPKLQLGGQLYDVNGLNQASQEILVHGQALQNLLDKKDCASFSSINLPNTPSIFFEVNNITLFKCPENLKYTFQNYTFQKCNDYNLYYRYPVHHRTPIPDELQYNCSVIKLPLSTSGKTSQSTPQLFELLTADFTLNFHISPQCLKCHSRGGQCVTDGKYCIDTKEKHTENKTRLAVILGIAVPGVCIIVILGILFIWWWRKQLNHRKVERDSSADIEDGTSYLGVPVFSYKELEEATHNFDPAKELGDGGFGTVYYGKLRDGRDVAVKRCYENNYRRVEQFMNEIRILTLLRHRNLVILYGSTSRRSRDLLLVYEYISNGTLADHIHGDKSTTEPLIWPVRMNIAIEIASALSYLHKSDIIHRDVKTNNILLDNNFCVKVADFGLSRLFPTDVTHVSTAPQGTPGYVDPEYHQCYQLTDKSDVYSFGVVLVELISSLPAVDINRQRNDINLANLAIDRIQKCALHELIDPFLGQEASTAMMTTSVAELAFRCLQLDKDLRPTMDEVLECLEQIQGAHLPKSSFPPPSPEMEDVVLLKKNIKIMDSPVSVANKWISTSNTPSISK